jgi:hypothetical protein
MKYISFRLSQIVCHAEDCNFVIEGVPAAPYGCLPIHYNTIEANMKLRLTSFSYLIYSLTRISFRREQVQKLLDKNEYILTVSAFPRYYLFLL